MMFLIGGTRPEYSTTPGNWTNMLDPTRVTPSGVVEMASCLVGACVCVLLLVWLGVLLVLGPERI